VKPDLIEDMNDERPRGLRARLDEALRLLESLGDEDLRALGRRKDELLEQRDRQRKDTALADAAAILAKAGLGLKDLARRGRTRTKAQPTYKGGRQYQHPANKALVWNAKGKKPTWLAALEAEGKSPVEVANA